MIGRVAYVIDARPTGAGRWPALPPRHALLIVDGKGYINPMAYALTGTAQQDAVHLPVWELTLALASSLGMRSYLWHQLVAVTIGSTTIVMTGLAGREAFGRRVGLIAAALTAVYAPPLP